MIADLQPYLGMRESGVVWLGKVPEGWDVLRGRQLFEIKKRISGELGHPIISVTQEGLRVKDIESGEGQLSQDYSKYQTVEVGEFAMNSMDLLTGGVGIATSPGVTSPDYRVFAVRDKAACCDRYMLHVLRMLYRNRGFYAWGQGSAQLGRWRLPRRRFNDFPFPVPSFGEQAAIARFLDWANGRLERAIRAKRKVIALLNEQKQAIIHRAVTRGLDPCVPLKPSGVPWLGDIPQHWEVHALKRACRRFSLYGANVPADRYVQSGVRFLRTTDISDAGTLGDKGVFISDEDAFGYLMDDGDFLVSRSGTVGRAFVYRASAHGPCAYAGYLVRFVLRQETLLPEFLWSFTKTQAFTGFLRSAAIASTIENVNGEKFANMPCVVPPVPEQRALLMRIATETTPLDTAFSRLEREIELLREYRTRLVADVVTGRLDVREAAARLSDEPLPGSAEEDTEIGEETEPANDEPAV